MKNYVWRMLISRGKKTITYKSELSLISKTKLYDWNRSKEDNTFDYEVN